MGHIWAYEHGYKNPELIPLESDRSQTFGEERSYP